MKKKIIKKKTIVKKDKQTKIPKTLSVEPWKEKLLGEIRKIIFAAEPAVVEELKWRGVPVWSKDGIICTGETYKNVVKMTFMKGASLKDPAKLFNSSLEGNARRAIDFHEGAKGVDQRGCGFKSI